MYCSFCGKEIEDGARFCNHCGAQLETGMQAGASGDAASVTSDATQVMPGAEFNSGATQVMPEAEHQSNPTQQMPQTPPAPDPNQLVTSSPFGPASNSLGNNTAGGTSSAPGMPGAPSCRTYGRSSVSWPCNDGFNASPRTRTASRPY